MSAFTPAEIEYLRSQWLGRPATVGPDGQPHVVPLDFRYNPDEDAIDVGGFGIAGGKKWRDVGRNPRAAFVVDDIAGRSSFCQTWSSTASSQTCHVCSWRS